MGYIKSRANGTVQGMYCDICGKEYVRVIPNPNDSSQDMCVKCYNDFYNGGRQKDQQIAELKAENERLRKQQSIDDDLIEMQSSRLNNQEQQLKDNDEKIARIMNGEYIPAIVVQQFEEMRDRQLKDNTKQVCEKIREKVKQLIENKDLKLCNYEYANGYCYGLQYDLARILDQIEKGNKDGQ
ncbi:MAG: hypothetical protein ACI4PF_03540 [Christensenellales bacterium]